VATIRTPHLQPSVRLSILAGAAVLLFGCVIGFAMISNNSGVFQGAFGSGFGNRIAAYLGPDPATVGKEYPLIRPYTAGGDLVLLHAIGVHGLIMLAVPGILLARTAMPRAAQLRTVTLAVCSVAVAITILLVHAMRQLPLYRLSPAALVLLAACGLALGLVYLRIALAWRRRGPVAARA
jgi:hypothetical protein